MPNSIPSIIGRIEASQLVARAPLQGCTEEDLVRLERKFSLRLPQTYREFMLAMGRSAGDFLLQWDYSIDVVAGLRTNLDAAMQRCHVNTSTPASVFVFASHQHSIFFFFDTAMGDDPPVSLWCEKCKGTTATSFTEWLSDLVLDSSENELVLYGSEGQSLPPSTKP
jgi:hypothetical protein